MRRICATVGAAMACTAMPGLVLATTLPQGQAPVVRIITEPAGTTLAPATLPSVATPPPSPAPAATATPDALAPAAEVKPVEAPKPVLPTLIAKVNLTSQTMVVVVNGKPTYTWKVSSGADGYATPVGTFKPDWMAKMWYSKQYDNAPMPHAVFFKGGAAIHATTSVGRLGTAASHGCVRLSPANAETFFKLVTRHSLAMTRVAVTGRAAVHEDRIAKRDRRYETPARGQQQQRVAVYQIQQPQQPVRVANRGMAFPGDGYGRQSVPAGGMAANRTPYWVRN